MADESQPSIIEEASPLAIVAEVLGDLESEDNESCLGADDVTGDAQIFAFDTRRDEELPTKAPVEQPIEVTQEEVKPEVTPVEVREDFVETSPPRDYIINPPSESSFQTPPAFQSSPGSIARF